MKASLRDVRATLKKIVCEAFPFRPGEIPVIVIDESMIDDIFEEGDANKERSDVQIFVPFSLRKSFKFGSSLEKAGKWYGFQPKDAAAVLKKGDQTIFKKQAKLDQEPKEVVVLRLGENHVGRAPDEIFFDLAADAIVRRFSHADIDEVMAVDSRSSMATDLAHRVANGLNVPYTRELEKESVASSLDWDHVAFLKWSTETAPTSAAQKGVNTDVYIADMRKALDRTKKTLQNKLAKGAPISIAEDIKDSQRKFWNLFIKQNPSKFVSDKERPLRVLVIDDNFASGASFVHANKTLRAAGVEPFFAAGFYYDSDKR